jgi:hypothetical protein
MAAPSHGPSSESVHRAHDALLRHRDLQFDFPRIELPDPPGWLIDFQNMIHKAGSVLKILWWVIGGLALAALVYFVGRVLWRYLRPERVSVQDMRAAMAEWRPTPAQALALLTDADALADAGKYGEAVHLLLLRSIQDLESFRPRVVQRSYTAREIERLDVMPAGVRAAFAGIMDVVERSLFGDYVVTAEDYARCRSEYERFAFPDAWRSG